jgi:starch phosphorylase
MKAALNGVLPCTTRDGWVAEVELYGVGWALDSEHIGASLMDVLEQDIVPMYYDRDVSGVPTTWERHMRNARQMVMDRFTATRMLREYAELLYQ